MTATNHDNIAKSTPTNERPGIPQGAKQQAELLAGGAGVPRRGGRGGCREAPDGCHFNEAQAQPRALAPGWPMGGLADAGLPTRPRNGPEQPTQCYVALTLFLE